MKPNIVTETVENTLQHLIDKHNLSEKLTVNKIKTWIYNEEGDKAFKSYNETFLYFFSDISDMNELNKILQILADAWNCFPHKSLGGKSPYQAAMELRK